MKFTKSKSLIYKSIISITIVFGSCKKLVEVDAPVTNINAVTVFQSDATAIAVLTGIYGNIVNAPFGGSGIISTSFFTGLSSDELTLYSTAGNTIPLGYYTNSLNNLNTGGSDFWNNIYPIIFQANSTLEGLNGSNALSLIIKQQLIGEAKFVRAFSYFYLVNMYGDVPLVLSSDYKINSNLARTPKADVYQQIISDLKDAQGLLSSTYQDVTLLKTSTDRVRPNKWVATALLARAYLYTGDWQNAFIQSGNVISNSSQFSLSTLPNTFLRASMGNNEAIWQLQPVRAGFNTEDARLFIIPATGPSLTYPVYLSNNLLNSFEAGDQRKNNWIQSVVAGGVTYNYPYKYKSATLNNPVTEHEMVFRLSEQVLIRSEAEANGAGGGISAAISDLNIIRNRAMLSSYSGPTDKASVLNAIIHERQVELFTEWGHRWFDLKRSGTIDLVMNPVCTQKGGSWNSNWQLYPITLGQLQVDPNLTQNPGY